MKVSFTGISAARARLAELVTGLRVVASGEVTERAARKVQEQIAAVSRRVLGQHVETGAAQGATSTSVSGGLIQLTSPRYLSYHGWWPFRRGMPPFVVARAVKIFQAEVSAALGGSPSPLALADEAAEEAAAVKSRAQFKKDIAKIHRQSDAHKAGKAKERADRAREKRVKAREDRE